MMALLLLLGLGGPLAGDDGSEAIALAPERYREHLARALTEAGANRQELVATLRAVRPAQREAAAFLIANMPARDLTSLSKDFLVENIELACKARDAVPWGKGLPDELFLNDVVPYASINERRDRWRPDFVKRFLPVIKGCTTPGEAAQKLNATIFKALGVQYHATKRPKPDQSPCESIEAGYASCTGLSILLIDACRAVCVPARFVGTPLWVNRKGNHSWVEVWDGACWRFVGAAEPGPFDRTWFTGIASQADATRPEHRIYAASFARTGTAFPLVWDLKIRYVPAVDVTPFYTSRRKVKVQVVEKAGGQPVPREVIFALDGRIVAVAAVPEACELLLAGGLTYDVQVRHANGDPGNARTVAVPNEDGQTITLTPE